MDEDEDNGSDSPLMIVSESNPISSYKSRKITCSKQQYFIATIVLAILCILFAGLSVYLMIKENISSRKSHEKNGIHEGMFFQISDTHYDMYYNQSVTSGNQQMCRYLKKRNISGNVSANDDKIMISKRFAKFGRVGCDTPRDLLVSAAQEMNAINLGSSNPAEFVILSGDQSAHDYSFFQVKTEESVIWSIVNSTQILSSELDLPILMALGNNDLPDDYRPPTSPGSSFYKRIGDSLTPYIFLEGSKIASLNSREGFQSTFYVGGYYSVNVTEKLVVLLVNTNYWNNKSFSLNQDISNIGDMQMEWLQQQLQISKIAGKKMIICGHIPPGYSTYKNEASFWLANYTEQYSKAMNEFEELISGQLYGHVHEDKVKIQQAGDSFSPTGGSNAKSYVLICPSITPIYESNPAFRMFTFDQRNMELKDYSQYYIDFTTSNIQNRAVWDLEYTFSNLYSHPINSQSVNLLVENLISQGHSTWLAYASHMKTLYGGITTKTLFDEYCSARHVSLKAFHDCLDYYKPVL